ncbi:hypothetical protein RAH32_17870 [Paracoccus sp. WLY502]|uniref:hypothetical protein n=1 Tax=Paracoccus yibinensis TaxID=3068891 RepID=UPI002796A73D|nr:hypothetical protein [Paracoccus sp. WLY502]MDQ1902293.1 hypothetical protein [Paracoccus sp. WLY502]
MAMKSSQGVGQAIEQRSMPLPAARNIGNQKPSPGSARPYAARRRRNQRVAKQRKDIRGDDFGCGRRNRRNGGSARIRSRAFLPECDRRAARLNRMQEVIQTAAVIRPTAACTTTEFWTIQLHIRPEGRVLSLPTARR